MCLIIVCVVEVQFLINTLVNWRELPPHPLLLFVKLSWFLLWLPGKQTILIKIENVHQHCSKKLFKIYPLIIAATLENAAQNIYYALLRISYLEICPQPAHSILSNIGPLQVYCPALSLYLIYALLTHRSMHSTRHTPPPPPPPLLLSEFKGRHLLDQRVPFLRFGSLFGPYFIKVWVTD